MATNLTNYVLQLAQDPAALEQLQQNPQAAFENAGLSPAEQAVLTSGDPRTITTAIATDLGMTSPDLSSVVVITLEVTWVRSPYIAKQGV